MKNMSESKWFEYITQKRPEHVRTNEKLQNIDYAVNKKNTSRR